jgi:hypothetical protein
MAWRSEMGELVVRRLGSHPRVDVGAPSCGRYAGCAPAARPSGSPAVRRRRCRSRRDGNAPQLVDAHHEVVMGGMMAGDVPGIESALGHEALFGGEMFAHVVAQIGERLIEQSARWPLASCRRLTSANSASCCRSTSGRPVKKSRSIASRSCAVSSCFVVGPSANAASLQPRVSPQPLPRRQMPPRAPVMRRCGRAAAAVWLAGLWLGLLGRPRRHAARACAARWSRSSAATACCSKMARGASSACACSPSRHRNRASRMPPNRGAGWWNCVQGKRVAVELLGEDKLGA